MHMEPMVVSILLYVFRNILFQFGIQITFRSILTWKSICIFIIFLMLFHYFFIIENMVMSYFCIHMRRSGRPHSTFRKYSSIALKSMDIIQVYCSMFRIVNGAYRTVASYTGTRKTILMHYCRRIKYIKSEI